MNVRPFRHTLSAVVIFGVDVDGHNDGDRGDVMVVPGFDTGVIQPEVWPLTLDLAVEECLRALVDLGTGPRDLALANPLCPAPLQVVHRARRDALDVNFLDHHR